MKMARSELVFMPIPGEPNETNSNCDETENSFLFLQLELATIQSQSRSNGSPFDNSIHHPRP
jgi:hypothetical protein